MCGFVVAWLAFCSRLQSCQIHYSSLNVYVCLGYILYRYIGINETVTTVVYLTAEDETSVKDYKEIPVP